MLGDGGTHIVAGFNLSKISIGVENLSYDFNTADSCSAFSSRSSPSVRPCRIGIVAPPTKL
jgi:hypothetical protein